MTEDKVVGQAASCTGTQPHPPGGQLPQAHLSPQPPRDPPCPPLGLLALGQRLTHQWAECRGYQPWDSLSFSRAHQQSNINSRIPKAHNQRCWDPALPTRGLALAPGPRPCGQPSGSDPTYQQASSSSGTFSPTARDPEILYGDSW